MTLFLVGAQGGKSFLVEESHAAGASGSAAEPRRIDCGGLPIAAGAVNAHTHLYSGLAPLGMPAPVPPPTSFVEILERVWWRLDRALDEASLRAAARLYIAEALLAGTTTLVDHHESPSFIEGSLDVLGDAADELGVRLVTCFGATERNGGRLEARRGLAECARFVRQNRRPLVAGVVGLHASFTVSDETLDEAGALARELRTVVHVHVAEDRADVRTRSVAVTAGRSSDCWSGARCRRDRSSRTGCTSTRRRSAGPRARARGWCKIHGRTRATAWAIPARSARRCM